MKHMLMAALLGGWVSLATAEPLPAWHHPLPEQAAQAERVGQVLDTAAGRWLTADELVERLAHAEQVLVGEQHDNLDHHRLQLWLLQQLQHQRPQASLLLEMLTPSQQPAVDALQQQPFQGDVTDPEQQLQWNPGWDWALYGPLVEWVLKNAVPLRAANLDAEDITRLYRDPAPLSPRYGEAALTELREVIEASHCGKLPETQLAGMLSIQQQRDRRMGDALAAAPTPTLLLVGNFHARKDLGIALHLEEAAPLVVMLHEADEPLPGAEQADYVWLTPAAPRQDYCAQWQ